MSASFCFRVAALLAIVLSYPAVIGVLAIVTGPFDTGARRLEGALTSPQLFVAYAFMVFIAMVSAPRLGPFCAASFSWGALSTIAVFLAGTLSGCLSSALLCADFSLLTHVQSPVRVIAVVGFLPAYLLGLLTTLLARLARRFSRRDDVLSDSESIKARACPPAPLTGAG